MKIMIIVILILTVLSGCSRTQSDEEAYSVNGEIAFIPGSNVAFSEFDSSIERMIVRGIEWSKEELIKENQGMISSKEEAKEVGLKLAELIKEYSITPKIALRWIEHNPNDNIWIFTYGDPTPDLLGAAIQVAVDGDSGEIMRMWIL